MPGAADPVPEHSPSAAALVRRFWPDARPHLWSAAGVLALSSLGPALETGGVWTFKLMVDRVLVPRDARPLILLAPLLAGIAVLDGAVGYCQRVLSTRTTERFLIGLRTRVFRHLLALSVDTLERRRLGDLLSRLTADAAAVEASLLSGATDAFADALRLAFFAAALVFLEWRLALVAAIAVPLFWALTRRLSRPIRAATREQRRHAASATCVTEESLSCAALVQAYGREETEVRRFERDQQQAMQARLVATRARALFGPLLDLVDVGAGLAVIALGTWALSGNRMTLGGLLVFVTYLGKLYRPARGLGSFAAGVHSAVAGAERLAELLAEPVGVHDAPHARPLRRPVHGDVVFDRVSFRYPGAREAVLRDVSFRVRPGETIAIVGASGAGKSTLLKLLLRFHEPTNGRILLDERDLREVTVRSAREAMALVLQETVLLHASVRENIAYGRDGATDAEIRRAARDADAERFIEALPEGYDTVIGERGRRLSGGQRQRLAIARALVRRAPVLLLDEPTASLDAPSARRVLAPLRRAMEGRAVLLVSHDPAALQTATAVLSLQDGVAAWHDAPAIARRDAVREPLGDRSAPGAP